MYKNNRGKVDDYEKMVCVSVVRTDENAIYVYEGAEVSLKNMTVSRKSSDSEGGDDSSFYGIGAAVLTTDGTTYLSDSEITTDAAGGAGIFAYGNGVVYTANTKITTEQDTSGGIHAAGGGTLTAENSGMFYTTNTESTFTLKNVNIINLYCERNVKDISGETVTVKGTDGTVYVEGSSDLTITVNSYKNEADMSDASDTTSWSEYEVKNPF